MGKYLLGLDAGNTIIKAVLFDLDGRELGHAAAEGHSRMPKPGHVERGLDELWSNAQTVIRACIEKSGIAAAEIVAIGCAGHGNGLYALDRAGAPLLGIQSLDTRAAQLADELEDRHCLPLQGFHCQPAYGRAGQRRLRHDRLRAAECRRTTL
jgi:L-xylulokinase